MLAMISRWIERAFAPTLELLGDLPPRAVSHLFSPF